MQYLHTNPELTRRFFNYLAFNFSRFQVGHTLNLRPHPGTGQEMAFLSYRTGNHYIGFDGIAENPSFILRTIDREGFAKGLQFEIMKLISSFKGPQKDAYDSFFGNPGFSEKKVQVNKDFSGIETIVEVPFNIPKTYPWILEIFAFPTALSTFIRPANEFLFQKSKLKVT